MGVLRGLTTSLVGTCYFEFAGVDIGRDSAVTNERIFFKKVLIAKDTLRCCEQNSLDEIPNLFIVAAESITCYSWTENGNNPWATHFINTGY